MHAADRTMLLILSALALLFLGGAFLAHQETQVPPERPEQQERQEPSLETTGPAAVPASTDNWGLSFQEEGKTPVGNADPAALAQYDAYYVGDTKEKVLYLTFDCGYENGNTEPILDALKKHKAPAAFFVVGNMVETAPERAGSSFIWCHPPSFPFQYWRNPSPGSRVDSPSPFCQIAETPAVFTENLVKFRTILPQREQIL